MTNITQTTFDLIIGTSHKLLDQIKNEIVTDEVVDSWLFMSSPWPVSLMTVGYFLFILKVGPKIMKNREPFNLKYMMLLYNLWQIWFNGYIALWFFLTPGAVTYHFTHFCYPLPRNENRFYMNELDKASWCFFLSKIIDLLDTVFFVLRKKKTQVTFLHVYHHTSTLIICWLYLKFIKGEQLLLGGLLNSSVHVVMYTYYFIAALGPQTRKYLWWKKYVTRLQIVQFIIDICMLTWLCVNNCNYPKVFLFYLMANFTTYLVLFSRFYIKTYKIKPKSQ